MSRLTNRDFLKETDFTSEDLIYLLDLAAALKKAKQEKREPKFLLDKNIVLLFEKDSTRTRCSFEVAAHDQGAHTTYLGPSGSQIGKKESMADTAVCCPVSMTASNTAALARASWKSWPVLPACRCGTA